MLGFLRRYQWYFFLVITIVIIISFSFFGSYGSLAENPVRTEVAFTAVDGTKVPRFELDETALFLSTDINDKAAIGGAWGPNFLNDGVITNDFLITGLAHVLAEHYQNELADELQTRLEKEKKYLPYAHPQAQHTVSAESAWAYFAPEIKSGIDALRKADNGASPEAFTQRTNLFLAEKKFPSGTLKRVLNYQQKQYQWLAPDRDLDYRDLSLFGYHTTEDWFGPQFMKLVAQFIINSAKIAESRGYRVTKEEVLADLSRQVDRGYQQTLAANPGTGIANKEEFYNEQLRRMGMDQNAAVRIWKSVLLFRRLFYDQGNALFVDALPFQQLNAYAQQSVDGDFYQLPTALRFNSFRDLQRFEIYARAIAKPPENPLGLPKSYLTAQEVAKHYPELVEKRYTLEIAEVDKNSLQTRVSVRDTWNWEAEDQNWQTLKKEFPELGLKLAKTREERFAALDALDQQTRSRIDTYARKAIVNQHPEWLTAALQNAKVKKITTGIRLKGGSIPFSGVENREELIRLLDQGDAAQLTGYTADQSHYYNITVLDKGTGLEILSFDEASEALDSVVKRVLDTYYAEIRNHDVAAFQKADGNWKSIDEVQDNVANRHFEGLLKAIREDYLSALPSKNQPNLELTSDFLATVRFYHHMRHARNAIVQNKPGAKELYHPYEEKEVADQPAKPLALQWQLEQTPYHTTRSDSSRFLNKEELFGLNEGAWSNIQLPLTGDIGFIQVKKKGTENTSEGLIQQMQQAQKELSADAQRALMRSILQQMPAE